MNIKEFSRKLDVRRLSEEDVLSVYDLFRGNTQYYEYCGRENTPDDIRSDMRIAPPGKSLRDKYYVGFFDGDKLSAVMDLIDGYPDPETAFIGFFMVEIGCQGKGFGTSLISELCAYLKQMGFSRIQLGIDENNPQARHFWSKNGFQERKWIAREEGVIILAERIIGRLSEEDCQREIEKPEK